MNQAKTFWYARSIAWRTQFAAWRAAHFQIGASEAMYLVGLASLFGGLWIWLGLGIALTCFGGVLIVTSVINDLAATAARASKAKNV
jgi:hypothetical protein